MLQIFFSIKYVLLHEEIGISPTCSLYNLDAKLNAVNKPWAQFGGGHGGRVLPAFSSGGDIICDVPPLFLFRFCIWRSSKNKSEVCHVLCEVLIILDVTHTQVDVETEFGVVLLDSVSLSVIASIK